ncbi:alginate O-acetyltransferase AlgX-related protein [Ruminococcus sp. LCP21S3_E8]
MKNKIKVIYICLGLFICLIPLIFVGTTSNNTNEESSSFPSTVKDNKININYISDLGNWFSKNCGFRTEMLSINSHIMSDVFGVSSVDNITVGKNGWLYASSTDGNYKGIENYSERIKFNIAHNVKLLQNSVEKMGCQFIFTVPANKNTLYPENMPYYIKNVNKNRNLSDLSKSFSKEKVNYVDLYNLFKSNDETLYLKKDSHWNGKGALLAYKSIMNKTKLPYDNYSKAKEFIDDNYIGDLSDTIYPCFADTESNPYYQTIFTVDGVDVTADSITTTNDYGNGSLLMYRDSFLNTLIPYFSGEFNIAHYAKTKSDYFTDYKVQNDIATYNPSVVVVEIVERHLLDMVYYAPEIQSTDVSNFENVSSKKTDTTCKIATKDNFYTISGEIKGINTTDNLETYVQITDKKGKSKTYPTYNMCYVNNNDQNDFGYKVYLTSQQVSKGNNKISIIVKNNSKLICVKTIKENLSSKFKLKSTFGSRDNSEIVGESKKVLDYNYRVVSNNGDNPCYLFNKSNKTIDSISLRRNKKQGWSKNILISNVSDNEKVNVKLSDKIANGSYDMKVTYSDKTTHILSGVPFNDLKSFEIYSSKNYSYIKYFSVKMKSFIDTQNNELTNYKNELAAKIARQKAIAEAKRKAAEKKKLEEASLIAQSIADEQATATTAPITYEQPTTVQQYIAPKVTEAPTQKEDDHCLEGIVINKNNQ